MTNQVAATALGVLMVTAAGYAQSREPTARLPPMRYIDPVNGLSLEDAIARALEREPSLRATRAQVEVSRGLQAQASLRANPFVSFVQQEEPSGTDNQTRVEVQWPLDLFRKEGRMTVAERELDVVQHAAIERERLLTADVRVKYGAVVAAARALSISETLLTATTRQETLAASRVEQGAAAPLDRDMLRVEVQRLLADRAVQSGLVERALLELKRVMGLNPEAALTLREPLEQIVMREQASDVYVAGDLEAAASRSDVRQAEAQVAVAEAQIDRAKRESRLDVSLVGMYMRMDAGFPQAGFGQTGNLERVRGVFHYVSGGAMVTLPVLNRNQGAVAALQAQRAAATAQADATRLTAETDIAAARGRDVHAREALKAFSADTMTLARQNLDVVRQTYELGRATLVDVLNEQRRYLELERAYTDVLREAFEARQTLKTALGEIR